MTLRENDHVSIVITHPTHFTGQLGSQHRNVKHWIGAVGPTGF
jgi:hypothetical protein